MPNLPMGPNVTAVPEAATFDYEQALQACASGDRNALQALYQQESRHLLGVALRIVRQRQQAEDVLHDAFMNIWTKAAGFDARLGSGRGWIYSVVRYRALDVMHAQRSEPQASEVQVDDLPAAAISPMESLFRDRNAMALHRCLERLDESKRACILLAYVEGFSQTQIAQHLTCPLGTVKAWTRRGLLVLKECLS